MKRSTKVLICSISLVLILLLSFGLQKLSINNSGKHNSKVEGTKNNKQTVEKPKETTYKTIAEETADKALIAEEEKRTKEGLKDFDENMVNSDPYEKIPIDRDKKIIDLKAFGLQDRHLKVLKLDVKPRGSKIYYIDMCNLASSKLDDLVVVNKTGYEYKQYIDNNKVVRMVNEVMNSNFKDKDYILSVLHEWFIKDFSKCREEYDYFYKKVV